MGQSNEVFVSFFTMRNWTYKIIKYSWMGMLKFKGYENVVAYVQGVVGFNKDHVVNIAVYSL